MNPNRSIAAPDGIVDWRNEAGPDVTKLVLGTPPTESGGTDKNFKQKIPGDLAALFPNLTHLHLWGAAALEELPVLPAKLQVLDLRKSSVRSLPADFAARFPALEVLDLGHCAGLGALAVFPEMLRELHLDQCPALRGELPPVPRTLEVLDLAGTPGISSLPAELLERHHFPSLRDLRVEPGVAFGEAAVPDDFVGALRGQNALSKLLEWHKAIVARGGDTTPYLRVFLLGNGRAGKTQVRRLLAGEELTKEWDSTHGAQLATVLPGEGRLRLPGLGLSVWDFGGQDIYHGTHALFTDARAFYIIVWTRKDRRDEHSKKQPLQYWLDYVSTMGRDGGEKLRVVLAESECSGQSDPVGANPGLEIPANIEPVIIGYDLLPGEDVAPEEAGAELLKEIARSLGELGARQRRSVAKNWAEFRDWLRAKAKRLGGKEPLLAGEKLADRRVGPGRFVEWCGEFGIVGDAAVDAVRLYLHEAGAIFHKPSRFGGNVVVDQQWALNAIYTIFDRKKCAFLSGPERDGTFTLGELRKRGVWDEGISDEDAAVLLEMMKECGICFEWDKDAPGGVIYRAPELLPEKKRDVETTLIETVEDTHFLCVDSRLIHYDLLHDGVLRGLMTEVGGEAGKTAFYWRSGFFAAIKTGEAWVRVEVDKPERGAAGTIRVRVYGLTADSVAAAQTWERVRDILLAQKPNPADATRLADAVKTPAPREAEASLGKGSFEAAPFGGPRWRFKIEPDGEMGYSLEFKAKVTVTHEGVEKAPETKQVQIPSARMHSHTPEYVVGALGDATAFSTACEEFGRKAMGALTESSGSAIQTATAFGNALASGGSDHAVFQFSGGADFMEIPWELLRHGDELLPAVKFVFRRGAPSQTGLGPSFPTAKKLRVLWVVSRPVLPSGNADSIPEDCVLGPVQTALGASVELDVVRTFGEFREKLRNGGYHVVHLDMHGDLWTYAEMKRLADLGRLSLKRDGMNAVPYFEGKKLVLRFADGKAENRIFPITPDDLKPLLTNLDAPPVFVLNACKSGEVPDENVPALPWYLMDAGVAAVVAFQSVVSAPAAEIFYKAFYKALASGSAAGDVDLAVRAGRQALKDDPKRGASYEVEDWFVPVYYAAHGVKLFGEKTRTL